MSEEKFLGVTFLTEIIILVIVFVGAYFIFKPVLRRDKERREQIRKEQEQIAKEKAEREKESGSAGPREVR